MAKPKRKSNPKSLQLNEVITQLHETRQAIKDLQKDEDSLRNEILDQTRDIIDQVTKFEVADSDVPCTVSREEKANVSDIYAFYNALPDEYHDEWFEMISVALTPTKKIMGKLAFSKMPGVTFKTAYKVKTG